MLFKVALFKLCFLRSQFIMIVAFVVAAFCVESAQANSKYAAFVYDANKGKVLFARNADKYRYPASLTKMMTLYMVFDAIDAGKITLSTRMKVSKRASGMSPSKLYLKSGSTIRVKDAILALVTKSANDVAVVIAEHLAGSEIKFAKKMTRKARSIGMSRTTFANASGLPNTRQRTTARDMARLGLSLRQSHPRSFKYFSTRSFRYGKRAYRNHNRLLGRVGGVNGIKTGYTRASGFNLVTNVETNGRHMVAVVLGGKTGRSRDAHMTSLINRYIKKASRKNRNRKIQPLLVASSVKKNAKAKTVALVNPPIPKIKPQITIQEAAKKPPQTPKQPDNPVPQSNPVVVVANTVTDNKLEQGSQGPQGETTPVAPPSIKPASAQTASAPVTKPQGWKIQLSATPNLTAAKEMLAEASAKGGTVLARKTPYTETIKKGNNTLYRVRFAGFADQHTARQACVFMKRKKYNCIYLN